MGRQSRNTGGRAGRKIKGNYQGVEGQESRQGPGELSLTHSCRTGGQRLDRKAGWDPIREMTPLPYRGGGSLKEDRNGGLLGEGAVVAAGDERVLVLGVFCKVGN